MNAWNSWSRKPNSIKNFRVFRCASEQPLDHIKPGSTLSRGACDGTNDCHVLRSLHSDSTHGWFWKLGESTERPNLSPVSHTNRISFNEKVKAYLDGSLPQQGQQGQTASQLPPGLWLEHGTRSWRPPWGLEPGRSRCRSNGCLMKQWLFYVI